MSARDDILRVLDPEIRKRIEKEPDRYAPLLALFAAWKEEVDGHIQQVETNVVERLACELCAKGDWHFPVQTLAVPQMRNRQELTEETEFNDRAAAPKRWVPCGPGWTLPTRLTGWSIEEPEWGRYLLVCTIEMDNPEPDARLLTRPVPPDNPVGQQQLAFVAAPEPVLAALASAPWALQQPGGPFEPVSVSRYEGYLNFEKGIGAARLQQRQLAAWLPPFYPYGRKFLRFYLPAAPSPAPAVDWAEWLGPTRVIRLAAQIDEKTADYLTVRKGQELFILNAVPVAQMRSLSDPVVENPDIVGDHYRVPFASVKGCFAASVRESAEAPDGPATVFHPARLLPLSSSDPRSRPGFEDVDVEFDRMPTRAGADRRVRIFYESFGESVDTPGELFRPRGQRYSVPFPAVGGLNAPVGEFDSAGSRRFWYQSLLRSPQLTEGDVLEILQQLPDCRDYLFLNSDFVKIKLDIDPAPWITRTHWDSYLWPTLVPKASLLEQRASYLSAATAIVPIMQINFQRRPMPLRNRPSLPDFLVDDLLQHAASVLSTAFMLGWYRVVGRLGPNQ